MSSPRPPNRLTGRASAGPNGSGISNATKVPTEFGPDKNLLWKLPLPQGHSSPILFRDRIYLTALRDDTLVTIAIDRGTGKIVWERGAPKVKTVVVDKRNNPASPSPAVDERGVYVFFPDYGLIAYDLGGKQLWTMPLGPFNNIYGMGASPVIVGDNLVLACDQSLGSYVMAVNRRTGRVAWKIDRPEAKSGHSTPILWRGPDGKDQVILPGSFLLTSYDAATGSKLWWVGGLSFEMKSTPVIGGDTIYVNGYGAPVNDPGNKVTVPTAEEVWKTADADGNGMLSKAEFPKYTPGVLVWRRRSRSQRLALERRVVVLPRGARFRKRHAGDSSRRFGRHERHGDPLEVSAQRAAAAVADPVQPRVVHGQRQRHRDDAQSGYRRGDQAGASDGRSRRGVRVADCGRRQPLLHDRGRGRCRGGARRRFDGEGRQRSEGRHLRDAGVRRRPHLRADDAGALRVWSELATLL